MNHQEAVRHERWTANIIHYEKKERVFLKHEVGDQYILVWVSFPTMGSFLVNHMKIQSGTTSHLIRVDIITNM